MTSPRVEPPEKLAQAICKSRTCEGIDCCQWPANGGRRDCPVREGKYNDAALAVLGAIAAELSELRESKAIIARWKLVFQTIERICDAPHWTTIRRWGIRDRARAAYLEDGGIDAAPCATPAEVAALRAERDAAVARAEALAAAVDRARLHTPEAVQAECDAALAAYRAACRRRSPP